MNRLCQLKSAPVGVVDKVLRILELLERSPEGLSLKDIAHGSALNKSTALRFLSHLAKAGYLFRNESRVYTIGPKLARLGGGSATYQNMFCRISRPVLERVWSTTGETVNLAMLDGPEVLYMDVMESRQSFKLASAIKTKRPAYTTALGKAILARMDAATFALLLHDIQNTPNATAALTGLLHLKQGLTQCQPRRYAIDDQEAASGARCIGAAILDAEGRVTGGISISGPVTRVTRRTASSLAQIVCAAADEISSSLGYVETRMQRRKIG
jgi:IclR family KDG regulon transcriptional repressor